MTRYWNDIRWDWIYARAELSLKAARFFSHIGLWGIANPCLLYMFRMAALGNEMMDASR